MGRKLYVGNLPYETNEQDLQDLFAQAGSVETVTVMRIAHGRARGFAFVEMSLRRRRPECHHQAERSAVWRTAADGERGTTPGSTFRRRRWRRLRQSRSSRRSEPRW